MLLNCLFLCSLFAFSIALLPELTLKSAKNTGDYFINDDPHQNFTTLHEALQNSEKYFDFLASDMILPSLVFGITVKGKLVWQKATGQADLENAVPAKIDTKYRVCSISKTFISVLIGKLVEEGKLAYDDSIGKYLSEHDFPSKSWNGKPVNITLRQLLSHTAGTHATDVATDFANVLQAHNSTEAARKFKDLPLNFAPGTAWTYSNYGYNILGAVIESVTGKPLPEVMSHFITNKLALNNTVVDTFSQRLIHNRARYYRAKNMTDIGNIPTSLFDDLFFVEGYWAPGGILSTVDDLLEYGNMLLQAYKGEQNAILKQKTIKQMWTSQTDGVPMVGFPQNTHLGLGFFLTSLLPQEYPTLKLRHYISHSGGLEGTTTWLIIFPEKEIVGVAMTNKGRISNIEKLILKTAENIYDFV